MGLSPGTKLGVFEIAALIGKGGMGEVYRARDTKLGRDVAIKVLPEVFAAKPERLARFEREAQMLAALDHPNVGALYEFRHEDGIHFLVMQLVEGDTLSDRIDRGPISVRDALPIFAQIAEALEAAHDRGIIHRDLKPANIKVSRDGSVKVLDFGLAKPQEPHKSSSDATTIASESPTKVTTDGTILGTPSYMSPEQARGQEVDRRADIWAFGCCFYEALTGRVPFEGDTVSDTIAAILEREPDYEALSSTLPDPILRLLRRALKKDVRNRLRDIGDARIELQELVRERERAEDTVEMAAAEPPARRLVTGLFFGAAGFGIALVFMLGVMWLNPGSDPDLADTRAVLEPIRSLVVLPFTNLSGDTEQEYFVDGMTEALIAELAKIRALKVISRTSAMSYKDTDKSIPEIVRELNVDGVIEGSVYRSGSEVRITAQLIHGETDQHLWAENYMGTLAEALKLQGEVALAIAREIEVTVTPEDEVRVASIPSVNPETHDLYLRGRYFWNKRTPEALETAIGYFEGATEFDPQYAEAWAGLAETYALLPIYTMYSTDQAAAKVRETAGRALALDETEAAAHAALGFAYMYFDWDWENAEREYRRAIELEPDYATGHHWYGILLHILRREEEAEREYRTALRLDPVSLIIKQNLGGFYLDVGRYDRAIDHLQTALEIDPNFINGLNSLVLCYMLTDDLESARETLDRLGNAASRTSVRYIEMVGLVDAREGNRQGAYKAVDQLLEIASVHDADGDGLRGVRGETTALARLYFSLGDKERGYRWLEQAFENRLFNLTFINVESRWDRSDPRFQSILRRMNLWEEGDTASSPGTPEEAFGVPGAR